jgi:G3E family GTPase
MSEFENKKDEGSDSDEEEVLESEKTPVTIVTGFLGAGKTTLVNYILTEQNSWKICVVENEFGEVSIDDSLVGANMASKEDIIMMENGCVCCSVRGDLVRTFGMLCSRRKTFDAIIIETTGLADPAPILFTFNSNALLQDNYRIDSIVCLVDAKHVGLHLDEVKPDGDINEAENQIAFSDRIILNKLDLVNEEELEDIYDRIRSMNSFAHIIRTVRSRAPLDQILGLNSFSLERVVEVDPTIMDEEDEVEPEHVHDENCDHSHDHEHSDSCQHDGCTDHSHDHSHEHEHEHHDHDHTHEATEQPPAAPTEPKRKKKKHNLSLVTSVGYTVDGLLDIPKFNQFMSELLQRDAKNLFRTKGVLAFAGQGNVKYVFQGVHEQINFGPCEDPWKDGEKKRSKLVFIGKELNPENMKEQILQCTEDPSMAQVTMHKRG